MFPTRTLTQYPECVEKGIHTFSYFESVGSDLDIYIFSFGSYRNPVLKSFVKANKIPGVTISGWHFNYLKDVEFWLPRFKQLCEDLRTYELLR